MSVEMRFPELELLPFSGWERRNGGYEVHACL